MATPQTDRVDVLEKRVAALEDRVYGAHVVATQPAPPPMDSDHELAMVLCQADLNVPWHEAIQLIANAEADPKTWPGSARYLRMARAIAEHQGVHAHG